MLPLSAIISLFDKYLILVFIEDDNLKTFQEFLNERSFKGVNLKKVTKEELRDAILAGEDISLLDYSEVTDMSNMFKGCRSLISIPEIDTSKVTDMSYMFGGCSSFKTITEIDTSKVTKMNSMFYGCHSLTSIPEMDTSEVTDMSYMFNKCSSLTSIPEMDTSKVTDMNWMFSGCGNLETLKNPMNFIKYDFKYLPKILEKYPELRK
jgi:surface protein